MKVFLFDTFISASYLAIHIYGIESNLTIWNSSLHIYEICGTAYYSHLQNALIVSIKTCVLDRQWEFSGMCWNSHCQPESMMLIEFFLTKAHEFSSLEDPHKSPAASSMDSWWMKLNIFVVVSTYNIVIGFPQANSLFFIFNSIINWSKPQSLAKNAQITFN